MVHNLFPFMICIVVSATSRLQIILTESMHTPQPVSLPFRAILQSDQYLPVYDALDLVFLAPDAPAVFGLLRVFPECIRSARWIGETFPLGVDATHVVVSVSILRRNQPILGLQISCCNRFQIMLIYSKSTLPMKEVQI